MNGARDEILSRVRATAHSSAPVVRAYRWRGSLTAEERTELFCVRVGEYQAEVRRIAPAKVAAAVASVCRSRGVQTIVAADGVPREWRSDQVTFVVDDDLSTKALDAIGGALTGCTVAIAETGTIVLTSGGAEGRRVLTLVPDLHLCVVDETQIVELVPEAFAQLIGEDAQCRPLTFISGPSATSDIELTRVEGVHGPRDLVVLVVEAATSGN